MDGSSSVPCLMELILEISKIRDKIKIKLEERYQYKKFFRTEKKLFELDKYGRKIKDIVYLREYIELTSFYTQISILSL